MKLFKVGLAFSVLPFVIGLLIYFVWFLTLNYFAIKWSELEVIGFYWILFSLPIGLVGMVLLFLDFFKDFRNNALRFVLGFVLLLANIPILIWILFSQGEVTGRAYLKIENLSGKNFSELVIQEPDKEIYVGDLDRFKTTVCYYNPDYKNTGDGRYPGISENYLVFNIWGKEHKLNLPTIHPGEVHRIIINEDLEIENHNLYPID